MTLCSIFAPLGMQLLSLCWAPHTHDDQVRIEYTRPSSGAWVPYHKSAGVISGSAGLWLPLSPSPFGAMDPDLCGNAEHGVRMGPDPHQMHNTMMYSLQPAQAVPQPSGAMEGHGQATREQTLLQGEPLVIQDR